MELDKFEKLCTIMKQYNVTSYKVDGIEINMQPQMDLSAFSQPGGISQPSDDELLENPYTGLEV